jgi:hypothetical protein
VRVVGGSDRRRMCPKVGSGTDGVKPPDFITSASYTNNVNQTYEYPQQFTTSNSTPVDNLNDFVEIWNRELLCPHSLRNKDDDRTRNFYL